MNMRALAAVLVQSRQVAIKKTERVRWFDHSDASGTLLIQNLIAERLHSCPVHFWPEMMLREQV